MTNNNLNNNSQDDLNSSQEVTLDFLLKFLQENMVTKEDLQNELKNFITKEDLQNELKNFATKDELKNFITKTDLKIEFGEFKKEIIDVLEKSIGHMKDDYVKMIRREDEKVDALVGTLQEKEVITRDDATLLGKLGPFPQPSI